MTKTFIIAEAGVNHNGSLGIAKKMIAVAKKSGANAVKFQTFTGEKVISKNAPKAEYQLSTTGKSESQLEMVKKLELSIQEHIELLEYSKTQGIQFLSTPFDLDSVDILATTLDLPTIKIPSGEITNAPLLLKVASTQKDIILSTGMSTIGEVETALGVLAFGYLNIKEPPSISGFLKVFCSLEGQKVLRRKVRLLHCTTEYPTPFSDINLKAMQTLARTFSLPTGLSDHSTGISAAVAAVALGATIIEKHFTLDKTLDGPDHKASLDPQELTEMVRAIRQTEDSLGCSVKLVTQAEAKNKVIARKSLIASCDIKKGETFSSQNVTVKRSGSGLSPMKFWCLLGKTATKSYIYDDIISKDEC